MATTEAAGAPRLPGQQGLRGVIWPGVVPLMAYHVGALFVFKVGFSWPALVACIAAYWTMIFGVSAGYHRYFAHKTFRTSRWFQFVLALLGAMSAQMGPLWWASHHRRHHQHADDVYDVHSPKRRGFLWSHLGWMFERENDPIDFRYVRDWSRFPELLWMDKLRYVPPLLVLVLMYAAGEALAALRPGWGASGWQLVVWGGFLATSVCFQATFCINSITHMFGSRRFETGDESRNVFLLALLTNGEGWHNNHHKYPSSERHGLAWWELDVTHYILTLLAKLGVVWRIKGPPPEAFERAGRRARS